VGAIILTASVSASSQVSAQPQIPAPDQSAAPRPSQDGVTQADANCPEHPDALGTSRILPLDPAQYPRVGHICVKVTYFMVGETARAYPAVVRRVYEEGHTIGTHSEDHPLRFGLLPVEKIRHEIDRGISDVGAALGGPKYLAPFFRIPGLARSIAAPRHNRPRYFSIQIRAQQFGPCGQSLVHARLMSLHNEKKHLGQ
jgi:Polysaccharide deacetylase